MPDLKEKKKMLYAGVRCNIASYTRNCLVIFCPDDLPIGESEAWLFTAINGLMSIFVFNSSSNILMRLVEITCGRTLKSYHENAFCYYYLWTPSRTAVLFSCFKSQKDYQVNETVIKAAHQNLKITCLLLILKWRKLMKLVCEKWNNTVLHH